MTRRQKPLLLVLVFIYTLLAIFQAEEIDNLRTKISGANATVAMLQLEIERLNTEQKDSNADSQELTITQCTVTTEENDKEFSDDVRLIALVTMAEAEGEPEDGKRLVIDTILNRIDSEHFPDTAEEVIYQRGQFSSMWNGRVDRCEVRDDICKLVEEELDYRVNTNVMFFNAGHFSAYGTPMFQLGNHYFSSYT